VAGESGRVPLVDENVRRLVPLFAFAVAVVAAVADPASSLGLILTAVPVAAIGLWVCAPG
jgi:hypothetical protein